MSGDQTCRRQTLVHSILKAKTRELGRKYSPGRKCDDQCNETDSCLAWTYSVGIIG